MAAAPLIARSQTVALVATLIFACREPSPGPSAPNPAVTTPTESSPPAAAPSIEAPGPTNGTPAESKPADPVKRNLSEEEMVTVLIDSKFTTVTPEGAQERLALLSNARERRPVDTTTEVSAEAANAHFLVSYIRDGRGGWEFSNAKLTRHATNAIEAKRSYDRFASLLRARFGKPVWTQEGSPPMLGWNAGGPMEVSLLQHQDEPDKFVVELMFAEPQGESEE
jgi:hypothetical protein